MAMFIVLIFFSFKESWRPFYMPKKLKKMVSVNILQLHDLV